MDEVDGEDVEAADAEGVGGVAEVRVAVSAGG
jgi:hypothetical protein